MYHVSGFASALALFILFVLFLHRVAPYREIPIDSPRVPAFNLRISRKLRIIGKFLPSCSSFQIRIAIISRSDLVDTVGSVTFRSPGTSIIPLKKRKRSDEFLAWISIPMNSDETRRIAAADNRGESVTWLSVCGFPREWQSSDSGDPRWRCTPHRDLWRLLYIALRNAGAILGRYAVIISARSEIAC